MFAGKRLLNLHHPAWLDGLLAVLPPRFGNGFSAVTLLMAAFGGGVAAGGGGMVHGSGAMMMRGSGAMMMHGCGAKGR